MALKDVYTVRGQKSPGKRDINILVLQWKNDDNL